MDVNIREVNKAECDCVKLKSRDYPVSWPARMTLVSQLASALNGLRLAHSLIKQWTITSLFTLLFNMHKNTISWLCLQILLSAKHTGSWNIVYAHVKITISGVPSLRKGFNLEEWKRFIFTLNLITTYDILNIEYLSQSWVKDLIANIYTIGAAVYQWCDEFKSRRGKNKNLSAQS